MIVKIKQELNTYEYNLKEKEDQIVALIVIDELFKKKLNFQVEFKESVLEP